jgi:tryptophan-rich sensory protein
VAHYQRLVYQNLATVYYQLFTIYSSLSCYTASMDTREWYRNLQKPSWAPHESVFGQAWSILYPIIFAVNIYIIILFLQDKISYKVALPFWLNLFFNLIFTPIQFGLRNNFLAVVDILLVFITIIWAMIAIWPVQKLIIIPLIPYLIWVGIASVLQITIWLKN